MRLFPPVAAMMTRRLTREIELGDVGLPARSLVTVAPWLLHRRTLVAARAPLAVTLRPVGDLRLTLEARR